jgi:hypothetical protein
MPSVLFTNARVFDGNIELLASRGEHLKVIMRAGELVRNELKS